MSTFQSLPPTGTPAIEFGDRPRLSGPFRRRPLVRPVRYLSDLVISAGMVAIFVLTMAVVGRLGETFRDFQLKLPGITLAILSLNTLYVRFLGWATVWVIPFVAALVLGQADRRRRRILFLAAYLLMAAFILVIVLAMMIPVSTLIENMSASGAN